jgi:hypothetical protein
MKKYILLILLFPLLSTISFAQEATENAEVAEKDKPVVAPFESGYLIDAQTTVIPAVKTLEFVIQHKFASIENGASDLWGIYGAGTNIRLGTNYVLFKNFQIGAGLTKQAMTTDLNAKWTIMQQTRKDAHAFALALYGNVGIDGRAESAFGSGQVRVGYSGPVNEFAFTDRLSYFSSLILGRKFNDWLTLQTAISFSHYNAVVPYVADEAGNLTADKNGENDHDKVGIHFNGRIKVRPQGSIIFNYDMPLDIKELSEQRDFNYSSKPNLAFGYEVSTGTHAFQFYMGTAKGLLPQDVMMNNQNDYTEGEMAIGFTITRYWGF